MPLNDSIPIQSLNKEKILAAVKNRSAVSMYLNRWDDGTNFFLHRLVQAIQERYQLNDNFFFLYFSLLKEILINAHKESDFVFLVNYDFEQFLKNLTELSHGTAIDSSQSGYLFQSFLKHARDFLFMQSVIRFQKKQTEFYSWISEHSLKGKPILVRDLPEGFHDIYRVMIKKKTYLGGKIHTKVNFDLEKASLTLTVVNKSYLDDNQIRRLLEKILGSTQKMSGDLSGLIDESQGGHGLGGIMMREILYDQKGFGLRESEKPFVMVPDNERNEVSITLSLGTTVLEKFRDAG